MEQKGMGTTATCAWVIEDRLYGMNVGNSRLYLLRAGTLRQLSKDHSWVQEAMDLGAITSEQARNHPNSHVITRYLGTEKMVPDDRLLLQDDETEQETENNQGMKLMPGDMLFLCSDGLSDVVEDFEIEAALRNGEMNSSLEHLIALANARGGPDNITVVALQVPAPGQDEVQGTPGATARRHGLVRLLIYLVSSAFLALVLVLWWLFLR
jgi:protein phosphatase